MSFLFLLALFFVGNSQLGFYEVDLNESGIIIPRVCQFRDVYYYNGDSFNSDLCECRDNQTDVTLPSQSDSCMVEMVYNVTSPVTGYDPLGNSTQTNPVPFEVLVAACPSLTIGGCADGSYEDLAWDFSPQSTSFTTCYCPRCKCTPDEASVRDQTTPRTWMYYEDNSQYQSPQCYGCQCLLFGDTKQMDMNQTAWACSRVDGGDVGDAVDANHFECGPNKYLYQCVTSATQDDWFLFDPPTNKTTPAACYGSSRVGIGYESYCSYSRMDAINVTGNAAICMSKSDKWDTVYRETLGSARDMYGCTPDLWAQWPGTSTFPLSTFSQQWLGAAFGPGNFCPEFTTQYYEYNCSNDVWVSADYSWKYHLFLCNDKPNCNQFPRDQIERDCVANTKLGNFAKAYREYYYGAGKRWYMTKSNTGATAYSRSINNCGVEEESSSQNCYNVRTQMETWSKQCNLWKTFAGYIPARKEYYWTLYYIEAEFESDTGAEAERIDINGWNKFYGCGFTNLTYCDITAYAQPYTWTLSAASGFNFGCVIALSLLAMIFV